MNGGNKYLRSIEKILDVVSKDSKRYYIMDHDFRPIFRSSTKKIAGFYKETGKKRGCYVDMAKIFDSIKNCGFRHTGTNKSICNNFENHVKFLEKNELERYFTKNITDKLIEFKILDSSDTSLKGLDLFSKSGKKHVTLCGAPAK